LFSGLVKHPSGAKKPNQNNITQ